MFFQAAPTFIHFVTVITLKYVRCTGVFLFMPPEIRFFAEKHSAFLALVRFFSGMNELVIFEAYFSPKALSACRTHMGLAGLTIKMCLFMCLQIAFLAETFPTFSALVRFDSSVNKAVRPQD